MFQSDQSDGILCSVISDYDRYACGTSLDNASFSCATFFAGGSGSGDWTDSGDDCGEIQGCSALVFGADGSADVSDTGYLSNVDSAGMVIPSGNATFGDKATFVFQIDITTPDNKKETRIEELTFDAAGSHSVTIEKIPAGSHVTVTEVYSGASYELASAKSQETDIIANPEKKSEVEFRPAEVSFINKHDGRTNGGYGIRNNFKLDETDQYQHIKKAATN